ncbi:hypothetical protein SDC9_134519 [bioreactor metagenome]|uniref:Uncharacterized protein n=1 Tax=bioreactor metagenome TaxID=1076179 RepID=A0A645DF02_9ZZZZ
MVSVRSPPSSYPTYPGGEPINLDAACFSIYSLMSNLTKSIPRFLARVLAISVLPTPVGPTKSMEATGLLSTFNPALDIFMHLTTCSIALS